MKVTTHYLLREATAELPAEADVDVHKHAACRAALIEGEQSGASAEFDIEDFIARKWSSKSATP